jgi:mannose-6-phosphate isomerase-like protein (cupin superfamily)
MAGYTIRNLKEVEDAAPGFGLSPGLEARFARVPLECASSGITYFRLAPSFRVPFGHRHGEQEEIYVVASGSARIRLEDEVLELRQWDAVRVDPGTMRNFEAGPDGAELIVFGAPNTGPADAEIEQGWWAD